MLRVQPPLVKLTLIDVKEWRKFILFSSSFQVYLPIVANWSVANKTVCSEAIIKEDSSSLRKKYSKSTLSYFNNPREGVAQIGIEYRHQSCKWYGLAIQRFPVFILPSAIPASRGSRGEQCGYISLGSYYKFLSFNYRVSPSPWTWVWVVMVCHANISLWSWLIYFLTYHTCPAARQVELRATLPTRQRVLNDL